MRQTLALAENKHARKTVHINIFDMYGPSKE